MRRAINLTGVFSYDYSGDAHSLAEEIVAADTRLSVQSRDPERIRVDGLDYDEVVREATQSTATRKGN